MMAALSLLAGGRCGSRRSGRTGLRGLPAVFMWVTTVRVDPGHRVQPVYSNVYQINMARGGRFRFVGSRADDPGALLLVVAALYIVSTRGSLPAVPSPSGSAAEPARARPEAFGSTSRAGGRDALPRRAASRGCSGADRALGAPARRDRAVHVRPDGYEFARHALEMAS